MKYFPLSLTPYTISSSCFYCLGLFGGYSNVRNTKEVFKYLRKGA